MDRQALPSDSQLFLPTDDFLSTLNEPLHWFGKCWKYLYQFIFQVKNPEYTYFVHFCSESVTLIGVLMCFE